MYDLIVVGGGPAGLTASIYAIRKRLNVLLVSKDLGGKTNFNLEIPWVQEYQVIRGKEIISKFINELEYLDFTRCMEKVEKIEKTKDGFLVKTAEGSKMEARAVIIASGTQQQWLDVPGERKYLSKGLCYSALSYAPLFIDKVTAVIGDGDLALRSAAELALVAEHVYVVGPDDATLDSPLGGKLKESKNVTILNEYHVKEVRGNGFANQLVVESPAGKIENINADGSFVEKKLIPNTGFAAGLVELDPEGQIVVDKYNRTSQPGIFAAGDVTDSVSEQVLVAIGEGAKAALRAYEYLLPYL